MSTSVTPVGVEIVMSKNACRVASKSWLWDSLTLMLGSVYRVLLRLAGVVEAVLEPQSVVLLGGDALERHKSLDVQQDTRQLVLDVERILLRHLVHDCVAELGER